MSQATNQSWGGRFSEPTDAFVARFTASVNFDQRLARQDIQGSIAHATMLARVGVLTEEERDAIINGLTDIQGEIERGEFNWSVPLEDVHMNIEARLTDKIGITGKKLHTGRSRNDQVATDIRLFMRDEIDVIEAELTRLRDGMIELAEREADTIMPGFTHLQAAQPVTLGHHLMAYYEMLRRDRMRFAAAKERLDECPLGAAALAGTGFDLDREATAKALGFARPTANSLDTVSDRDFAMDYLHAASIASIHLSRLAEEIIIWASQPFGFIRLPDSLSTGSSIMPQKKNPDAAELVRGHAGRIIGAATALSITMKGLPLAYAKDMQDDKPPVFEAHGLLVLSLASMEGMIAGAEFNTDRMLALAGSGHATATDLADWLVREAGVPFREAHHITGAAVARADAKGCALGELTQDDLAAIDARVTPEALANLTLEGSVASRRSYGGTAPDRVRQQVTEARRALGLDS